VGRDKCGFGIHGGVPLDAVACATLHQQRASRLGGSPTDELAGFSPRQVARWSATCSAG
jgi:hypothetical protein